MNRIILIGNGFDLTHNLKTKYEHFIDNFWKKTINEYRNKIDIDKNSFDIDESKIGLYENDIISITNSLSANSCFHYCNSYHTINIREINSYNALCAYLKEENAQIEFKNQFLKIITNKYTLENWVDVEEEYYKQLKDIVEKKSKCYENTPTHKAVEILNADFEDIKKALQDYLIPENHKTIKRIKNLFNKIYSRFNMKDLTNIGISKLVNEMYDKYLHGLKNNESKMLEFEKSIDDIGLNTNNVKHIKDEIRKEIFQPKSKFFDLSPWNTLFLSFNYTATEQLYKKNTGYQVIHLHGKLKSDNNPIIFGYGNEQDELHKKIENLGGKYLDNIKTINYSKKDNYKKLLNFIESDIYQVFIMGHSCGMSDRTLLKTLFEHENCISIKPFYYINEDGNDNYDDLIKNIYKVFYDKALMRSKVVNKDYCEPYNDKSK